MKMGWVKTIHKDFYIFYHQSYRNFFFLQIYSMRILTLMGNESFSVFLYFTFQIKVKVFATSFFFKFFLHLI